MGNHVVDSNQMIIIIKKFDDVTLGLWDTEVN